MDTERAYQPPSGEVLGSLVELTGEQDIYTECDDTLQVCAGDVALTS